MLDGKKKFVVALLTIIVFAVKVFFGKELNIDIDAASEGIMASVAVAYLIFQTFHDIYKEKTKQ